MPRPMWNGTISLGLVNVPVKMYNSIRRKTISFNQLRATDGCRIRLKKVCSLDGNEVAGQEIVRGYEVSPDRYVTITDEELEAVQPRANRSIEIEDFVSLVEIDPIYFEHSYYLVPDKGSAKAYRLLFAAMQKTGKIALARIVMRNKQYLAAIRPAGQALSLCTMYFSDEIVQQEDLEALPHDVEISERELTMAEQLITSLTAPFAPDKYRDEYREKVLDLIEKKAEGQAVTTQPAVPEGGKVVDLMAALEASLKAIKKEPPASVAPKARARRKKASAQ